MEVTAESFQDPDMLSPYWCVRRDVRATIPGAEPAVIDASAHATMVWWFRAFRLVGEAYGDDKELVIPRKCFDDWVVKYGL